MVRSLPVLLLLAITCLRPAPDARAQGGEPLPPEFDAGNENFPIHVYVNFTGVGEPICDLFPGQGLSGILFRDRPDGGPGWVETLEEEGFGSLAIDWPASGRAPDPINRDLIRALHAHVDAAFEIGRGSVPRLAIAHAEGAALLTKIRSYADYTTRTAVLIDPVGPQGAQPLEPISFDAAIARQETFEDDLWRRFGFGPRVGELYEGLDVDLETATAVFEDYDRDCFQIRPALLQPLLSPIRVEGTARLADWYVLVVRTPAADTDQIAREEAFTEWLRDAGSVVETLDLSADPELSGVTGLPWIGAKAPDVLKRFTAWYRDVIVFVPESKDLIRAQPGQSR